MSKPPIAMHCHHSSSTRLIESVTQTNKIFYLLSISQKRKEIRWWQNNLIFGTMKKEQNREVISDLKHVKGIFWRYLGKLVEKTTISAKAFGSFFMTLCIKPRREGQSQAGPRLLVNIQVQIKKQLLDIWKWFNTLYSTTTTMEMMMISAVSGLWGIGWIFRWPLTPTHKQSSINTDVLPNSASQTKSYKMHSRFLQYELNIAF